MPTKAAAFGTVRSLRAPEFVSAHPDGRRRYAQWVERQAKAFARRDAGRAGPPLDELVKAIHESVRVSGGLDFYTGEALDWGFLAGGGAPLAPALDRVDQGYGTPVFRLCAGRTLSAKGALSHAEFIELCRKVLLQEESRSAKL